MKRLSIALMAVGLSAPALANDAVCVPSQKGGFKISVDPLYLRSTPGRNINDSNFDWGFFAQVGYLFPCTGNDLTVNYTYVRSGENPVSLDLDDVNLEVGQRLTTGAFDMRLFSGVGYGHLNYAADMSTPENKQSVTGLFHGFGPRVGLDARYQLGNCSCVGLDTHLNTALLVGTVSTRSQNQYIAISESTNSIVPEVNAKLGIDYTVPSTNKSAFGVEIGYQTNNYLNTFNSNLMNGVSNANFDGVYLDIKYYS